MTAPEVRRIKDIGDIKCPLCGARADWDRSEFREWLDAETCMWDMEWFCTNEGCGHRWELGMEFTVSVVVDETDPERAVEYEVGL